MTKDKIMEIQDVKALPTGTILENLNIEHPSAQPTSSPGKARVKKPRKKVLSPAAPSPEMVVLGRYTALTFVQTGLLIFGDDWAANKEEQAVLTQAFANYFMQRNVSYIPPELMLVITLGGYIGSKIQKPTVKERSNRFLIWFNDRLSAWKKHTKKSKVVIKNLPQRKDSAKESNKEPQVVVALRDADTIIGGAD